MRKLLVLSGITIVVFAAAANADTEIDQSNKRFSQSEITLKTGETVNFVNKDTVTHNIKVLSGDDAEDKGLQKPGETVAIKFDKAGTYQVRCNIHPTMKMNVTVQ